MSRTEKSILNKYEKVPVQEHVLDIEEIPIKYGIGTRHIQLAILFLCLTTNFIGKAHMGVTIVAMTDLPRDSNIFEVTQNKTIVNGMKGVLDSAVDNNITKLIETDVMNNAIDNEIENRDRSKNNKMENVKMLNVSRNYHGTFKWPKSEQEIVLNAFFLGYFIMVFPIGFVCQRYGGKLPLQIALFVNTIVPCATPWLTIWGGWKAACACRVVEGLSQAGTYPCIQILLSKWASVNELASLSSYVYTGSAIGTVAAYQIAGFLGDSIWGWPSTFYCFGGISFICFLLLTIFGTASPMNHKSISEKEKKYILGPAKEGNTRVVEEKLKTPWRAMVTSKAVWGVLIGHIGGSVCYVFFLNQVPSYIHDIFGINVKNSGVLTSLPYMVSVFTSIGIGWLSDYYTRNNIINLTNARRLFNSIAQIGLSAALICSSYTNNGTVAITCLVIAMASHVAVHAGFMVNHIDIAPNFCGTTMATATALSMLFVLFTSFIVSYIVTDMTNMIQWRIMFFIIGGFGIVAAVVFFILVSTDVQPWNYADFNEKCGNKSNNITEDLEKESLKNQCNGSEISESMKNDNQIS